jgi:hypothetical protein
VLKPAWRRLVPEKGGYHLFFDRTAAVNSAFFFLISKSEQVSPGCVLARAIT